MVITLIISSTYVLAKKSNGTNGIVTINNKLSRVAEEGSEVEVQMEEPNEMEQPMEKEEQKELEDPQIRGRTKSLSKRNTSSTGALVV